MTGVRDEGYYGSECVHFHGDIDPKVKTELDTLNQSAMCLNRLGKELDEAKAQYQSTFAEFSCQLELLKKNISSSIKRARPFYELKEVARKKQAEATRSAQKFQSSNSVYLAESVSLAELRLKDDSAVCSSAAWEATFTQKRLRLIEAEKEKSISEKEHLRCAVEFAHIEKKMHVLEKKYTSSIAKSRSYFETKKKLEVKLQQVKQSVEDIQQAIQGVKQQYSGALKCLEQISDSIHENRCQAYVPLYPREPGVGSEDISLDIEKQPPTT